MMLSSLVKLLRSNKGAARLLSGGAVTALIRLVTVVFILASNVLIARLLTPSEAGVYFALWSAVTLLAVVGQLGLRTAIVGWVAALLEQKLPAEARAAVSTTSMISHISYLVLNAVLAIASAVWIGFGFDLPMGWPEVVLACVWLFSLGIQYTLSESFRGFGSYIQAGVFGGLISHVGTCGGLALLCSTGRPASLREVLQIIAISWFINYATMMVALFRQMQRLPTGGQFTFERALHESLPMLGTNIAVVMMQTTDTMIVSLLIAPAEAAFYGISSRLSAFLNVPAQIATNVVAPEISAAYVRNERDKLQRIVRTSATIAAVPAAGAGLILILGAPWILSFGFGPEYAKAAPLLILLTLGQLGVILNGSVNMLLMLTGNQRVTMKLTSLVAVTSLLLQIVAALTAGTVGVAFVCAAMLIGLSIAQNQMSRKLVGVTCQAYLKWNPLLIAHVRS